MYRWMQKLLFQFNAETAHHITLTSLQIAYQLGITPLLYKTISNPINVMGLTFPNRIGLAAGLDKNAEYIDAIASLGFGFIEVGTITPRPQTGNLKPRLFRLPQQEAIINRMGFNNKGAHYVSDRLKTKRYRGILGINIGKNRDTPLEKAHEDYLYCFDVLKNYASYFTINISSPNTEGLRSLQHGELLSKLLKELKAKQLTESRYIPLVVKIAPDLTEDELKDIAFIIANEKMDGVIATNTTLRRPRIESKEAGGLSGRPLFEPSTEILKKLRSFLPESIPIIASGGIMDQQTAQVKFEAGAVLLQVYTGLIYRGPSLIQQLAELK